MTSMRWALSDIAAALDDAYLLCDAPVTIDRVNTDTRTLVSGDLFVALKGERFDGAQFLHQAQQQGAAAVLLNQVARDFLMQAPMPAVLVPDTRRALGQMATFWRQRFTLPLIAVTGSNGKTTVTQMIYAVLRQWQGDAVLGTQGNLNNDIGVPQTLLRLRTGHRVAVVELGMNHPGEIGVLARMAQPTVALVNNAQREHQEFMGSVQAVAEENGSVLGYLPQQGMAVYPGQAPFTDLWRNLSSSENSCTFGIEDGDVHLLCADWKETFWTVGAYTPMGTLFFELHMPGKHNLLNALATIACCLAVQVPLREIAHGLSAFRPVAGRSNLTSLQCGSCRLQLIDDSYNANPDSVRALIDVLADMPGLKVLALGDMGEVGSQGVPFHEEIGYYAQVRGLDFLLTCGNLSFHSGKFFDNSHHFKNKKDMASFVQCLTDRHALVTLAIKGSRFMKMEEVAALLRTEVMSAEKDAAC